MLWWGMMWNVYSYATVLYNNVMPSAPLDIDPPFVDRSMSRYILKKNRRLPFFYTYLRGVFLMIRKPYVCSFNIFVGIDLSIMILKPRSYSYINTLCNFLYLGYTLVRYNYFYTISITNIILFPPINCEMAE